MPEAMKHRTNAQRQAAYRQRSKRAREQQLAQRGLPPLPAISTMPGEARWMRSFRHAAMLVETTVSEMEQVLRRALRSLAGVQSEGRRSRSG